MRQPVSSAGVGFGRRIDNSLGTVNWTAQASRRLVAEGIGSGISPNSKAFAKEIEARLSSWDKEKLVLVHEFLQQEPIQRGSVGATRTSCNGRIMGSRGGGDEGGN